MRPFSSTTPSRSPPNTASSNHDTAAALPPLSSTSSTLSAFSSTRSSLASSAAMLLSPSMSLAGLSWSHEEARQARLANRSRERLSSPPLSISSGSSSSGYRAPLPTSYEQSLAQSERLLEDSYSRLSLSPPSPTPSLLNGASSLFARPAHQRRLWPLQHEQDDDDERDERDSSLLVRSVPVASAAAGRLHDGTSGGGNGRPVSDRQRQQMQYTESLSPSPLEEPHEKRDEQLASATPSSDGSSADTNPLSAAILYVYSLVTTSPADVAGLRPRDFILAIDTFNKRGWQPDMIQDVSRMILRWPDERGDERLRLEVLRRIPLEEATCRHDIIWARTKKSGNGNGHNSGSGVHTTAAASTAARSSGSGSDGGGTDYLIALQRLELWSSIGRWHIDEPQSAEGGGVLGAVLCCYPDPQPVSSPPPTAAEPVPPPDLSCQRHYPSLQRGRLSMPSLAAAPFAGRSSAVRSAASSASTPASGARSYPRC